MYRPHQGFHHHRLDNGLDVITEMMPHAQSASFAFFVRCGAKNEPPPCAGVSHFLEHMVFKGSDRYSGDEVNRRMDAIGANFNACTTEECTVYYASLLPEYLPTAVGLFADILRPACREADFQAEKGVVLEEIHMYEEAPPFGADEWIRADFFRDHPLGHSVLGTAETVSALTAGRMSLYLAERYAPENILLAACGKVDFSEMERLAEALCGAWQRGKEQEQPPEIFTSPRLGTKTVYQPLTTQQYILQMALGPPRTSRLRYAARLLNSIVGDDSGSRLYWALVDEGRVEHALLSYAEYAEAGVFTASLCCDPEDANENMEILGNVYRHVEKHGVTKDELALARNRIATSLVLGSEKPWNRVFAVGGEWLDGGCYRTVREELDILNRVTLEDVHAVLEAYPLSRNLTYHIVPEEKKPG